MTLSQPPKSFNSVVLPHAKEFENAYPKQMLKHILHNIARVDGGRFLDLGGGWGAYTLIAEELGFSAISIDREPASKNTPCLICDIAKEVFPLESGTIDVVFSKSVIEHFYLFDLPHVFNEVKRVLKPGGHFVVLTPDWECNTRNFYKVFSHVTPYTQESLSQCLHMYGFHNVHVEKLRQLPETWTSSNWAFLAKLVAELPIPRTAGKWVRWSKELMLVGVAQTPSEQLSPENTATTR